MSLQGNHPTTGDEMMFFRRENDWRVSEDSVTQQSCILKDILTQWWALSTIPVAKYQSTQYEGIHCDVIWTPPLWTPGIIVYTRSANQTVIISCILPKRVLKNYLIKCLQPHFSQGLVWHHSFWIKDLINEQIKMHKGIKGNSFLSVFSRM